MSRKSELRLTTSRDDWQVIRECYVKSFYHYPLFIYFEPDETKRENFLRTYLDANFDVTVGSNKGVILALEITEEEENNNRSKLVGGILFVSPSLKGSMMQDDEVYWKSYENHQLGEISPEGLKRVKRYEAWEYKHVTKTLLESSIPVFNGLFCALTPELTSQGLASRSTRSAIEIMTNYWAEHSFKLNYPELPVSDCLITNRSSEIKDLSSHFSKCKIFSNSLSKLDPKQKHTKALSGYHCKSPKISRKSKHQANFQDYVKDLPQVLMLGVCHSFLSANFYKLAGFKQDFQIQYEDEEVSFYVSIFTRKLLQKGRLLNKKS